LLREAQEANDFSNNFQDHEFEVGGWPQKSRKKPLEGWENIRLQGLFCQPLTPKTQGKFWGVTGCDNRGICFCSGIFHGLFTKTKAWHGELSRFETRFWIFIRKLKAARDTLH